MENERPSVTIARVIGAPMDVNQPVSVDLVEICNVEPPLAPGEPCYTFTPDDGNGVDTVYTSDANGTIVPIKVVLSGYTTLNFSFIQTKLEYVLVQELAESPDQNALARRTVSFGRALDKHELKKVLDLVLALDGDTDVGNIDQEVVRTTGEDIYDLIVAMCRKVENFATDYVLLAGTEAYAEIEDYDKANAGNFYTAVSIWDLLKRKGIKVIKVFEYVTTKTAPSGGTGSDLPVLAADKMVLIGRNSKLQAGKPILFIRRLVRDLVGAAGGNTDAKERGIYAADALTPLYNGDTMANGYGVFSFESLCVAILNYRACTWCDATVVS